jgi:predicted metal-dependent hydrolase
LAAPGDVVMQPQLWHWHGEEEEFEHGTLEQ